jgi:predicted AAA+ superfamily ATPase
MSEQIDLGAPSLESATDLTDRLTDALRGPRRRKVDLAHFLGQATTDLGAMVRWADLAAALGLVKTSVSKYVKALTDAGALLVIHQHDPIRGGAPSLTRPRKVYLGDTGYAAIATDRPSVTADQTDQTEPTTGQPGQTANLSGLVENLLALALFRAFEPTMMGHFDGSQAIFTWKSVNGREVDFVVDERRPTPIQSVYGTRTRAKDYESLTKAFGRGIMASRLVTDTERPVMTIPAGVLLALLDDPSTRTDAPR